MRKRIIKTGILLIVLMLVAYVGIRLAVFVTSPFEEINTGNEIEKVEVKEDGNLVINALVMGLDKDETRTDTLIFVSYNSNTGKCFVMSIPRDTYVYINGRATLINAAYGIGGAELTINKVKELTGLPINYYVVFTFKDFRNVIDALGGVEFDVRPEGYYYDDPYQDLHINIPGGRQLLDGKTAEGLVRFRADYARADLERVEIQQRFISELIKQKFNVKSITSLPKVYNTLKTSLKSNLGLNDILAYSDDVLSAGIKEIETVTLPTRDYGAHLLPDEAGIKALMEQYFASEEEALAE